MSKIPGSSTKRPLHHKPPRLVAQQDPLEHLLDHPAAPPQKAGSPPRTEAAARLRARARLGRRAARRLRPRAPARSAAARRSRAGSCRHGGRRVWVLARLPEWVDLPARQAAPLPGAEGRRLQLPRDLRAHRRELHERQQAPHARAGARARVAERVGDLSGAGAAIWTRPPLLCAPPAARLRARFAAVLFFVPAHANACSPAWIGLRAARRVAGRFGFVRYAHPARVSRQAAPRGSSLSSYAP